MGEGELRVLAVGQSVDVRVRARATWTNTGIQLVAGQEYRFAARGRWWDAVVRRDADGYSSSLLRFAERWRRAPQENWFALIGAIDEDEAHLCLIGTARTLVAPTSGVLTCFANDVRFMSWNNWGRIDLTVTRVE